MGRYSNARNWQGIAAALSLAFVAAPATAQDDRAQAMWQPVDASTGQLTGLTDLQALLFMFPDSASVRRRLLNAYLEADRPADALAEAVELVRRGYVFSPAAQQLLQTLDPTDEQKEALRLQEANSRPIEASEVLATVRAEEGLVESVALDPASGMLFIGTIVWRALHVRNEGGSWSEVPLARTGSIAGLALDAGHEVLWIGSGVYDETPEGTQNFRGLIGLHLDGTGERYIAAPEGAMAGDIAVAQDGTLYASDPVGGAVYVAHADESELEVLVPPGVFRSPQGLVPWGEGLVVSDYGYGLAFVDRDGKVWRVESDVPILLDGIDGMWRYGDKIVAVQNGARPARIVALALSPDRHRIIRFHELERGNSAWTEPVGGGVAGDKLVYIGTGQWSTFGPGGALRDGAVLRPTELRVLPLGETLAPPP